MTFPQDLTFCQLLTKYLFLKVDDLEESNERHLQILGNEHLQNLPSINDQHRVHVQAVHDQHDEQLQAIEVNRKLCPTNVNWQNMEDLRRGELLNHNKKVNALEKKNTDQETQHVRMITMLDKVVDSQDNQLKH